MIVGGRGKINFFFREYLLPDVVGINVSSVRCILVSCLYSSPCHAVLTLFVHEENERYRDCFETAL
jgi:hypothetical protein